MEILYFLIPLAMIILVVIAGFFFWAVKSGQMDDLEGPAYRILMDDESVKPGIDGEQQQQKSQDEN